jgi:hypothetical protein
MTPADGRQGAGGPEARPAVVWYAEAQRGHPRPSQHNLLRLENVLDRRQPERRSDRLGRAILLGAERFFA